MELPKLCSLCPWGEVETSRFTVSPKCVLASVHIRILTHSSVMAGWTFYHDQVPWVTDARNIEFDSVSNFSTCNYGHIFINF